MPVILDAIALIMTSQITGVSIVYPTFVQVPIKENFTAPCNWPLFPFDDVIM